MPLFSNRFTHKKSPTRKSKSLSSLHRELNQIIDNNSNNEEIKLELDNASISFDTKTGQWIHLKPITEESVHQTNDLESTNKLLIQENRLLKLKNEILLQMVTEATAELQLSAQSFEMENSF